MPNKQEMPSKTAEVFKVLTESAKAKKTITYGEVSKQVGLHHLHVRHRLHAIWKWCESQGPGFPHLNAIAVNAKTGRPGSYYAPKRKTLTDADIQRMHEAVFSFNWSFTQLPPGI